MADLFGEIKEFGSELLGFPTQKQVWRLRMLDKPGTEFVGQFVAQNATENTGQRISTTNSVNSERPSNQFGSGDEETFTFTARIFAQYSFQNIHDKVVLLKSFSKRRDDLRRPPIFIFTNGTEIAFKCFVKSPGGIVYDEPRHDGSLRGATFSMNLVILEDIPTQAQGMSLATKIKTAVGVVQSVGGIAEKIGKIDVPGGSLKTTTRKHVVKEGDTFETIAQKEYGYALSGDILRRAHPDMRILKPGDKVLLITKDDALGTEVTQQSVMLKNKTENNARKKEMYESRSGTKTIFV